MPEIHSLVQLMRIKRPPLGLSNNVAIRQCRLSA